MSTAGPLEFGRPYRRMLLGVLLAGALVQCVLALFYLGVAHHPTPDDMPVGIVADSGETAESLTAQLVEEGTFTVTRYADADDLDSAIRERTVYGGFVVTEDGVQPRTATAAGALPAAVIKNTATAINAEQRGDSTSSGTDVVALPDHDSNGGSISSLMQVISLGGAVASFALGRLVPRAPRSLRRGLGHAGLLVAYAAATAAILIGVGSIYDFDASWSLFVTYAWISLAFTASTAAFVALLGPAGALSGVVYFLLGATISGATLPWEFLSPFWSTLGQWLPTGGGAYLLRSAFYFPDADNSAAHLCLALYAGVGVLVILITNALRNPFDRDSTGRLDLVSVVAGRRRGARM